MNGNIYRCGWCGNIAGKSGESISIEQWKKAAQLLDTYGDYRTIKVNGDCCKHEFNY